MVHVKELDLEKAIKLSKMRIKHHEKHGCGNNVINDKACLKKQERKMELTYPNHKRRTP